MLKIWSMVRCFLLLASIYRMDCYFVILLRLMESLQKQQQQQAANAEGGGQKKKKVTAAQLRVQKGV